jgi:hypothetical protein
VSAPFVLLFRRTVADGHRGTLTRHIVSLPRV